MTNITIPQPSQSNLAPSINESIYHDPLMNNSDYDFFYQRRKNVCRATPCRLAGCTFILTSLMSISCYIGYLIGINHDDGSH